MSKKRRDKIKAKASRHTSVKVGELAEQETSPKPQDATSSNKQQQNEKQFLRSADHLANTAPEWQNLYVNIRAAMRRLQ